VNIIQKRQLIVLKDSFRALPDTPFRKLLQKPYLPFLNFSKDHARKRVHNC
jgi:hypothetical protein